MTVNAEPGRLTKHGACGKTWRQVGNRTGHCSRCHQTFQGSTLFDGHQTMNARGDVVCADPATTPIRGHWLHFDAEHGDGVWTYPPGLFEAANITFKKEAI